VDCLECGPPIRQLQEDRSSRRLQRPLGSGILYDWSTGPSGEREMTWNKALKTTRSPSKPLPPSFARASGNFSAALLASLTPQTARKPRGRGRAPLIICLPQEHSLLTTTCPCRAVNDIDIYSDVISTKILHNVDWDAKGYTS